MVSEWSALDKDHHPQAVGRIERADGCESEGPRAPWALGLEHSLVDGLGLWHHRCTRERCRVPNGCGLRRVTGGAWSLC